MGPDLALLPRFLLLFDKSFLLFIVEGIGPRDATTAGVEREFIEEDFPTHLHLPDHPALQARLQPGRFENEAAFALRRSEEHTSALQSLMRISYAVFCLTTTITRSPHPN